LSEVSRLSVFPAEILNMINENVLPADRDVYTVKTFRDLPWAELGILSVAGVGIRASDVFYSDKTLVFDPTGIKGDSFEVRKNVYETCHWIEGILTPFSVKSVTLLLYGNIWQYFNELEPLAWLVCHRDATIYVNRCSYNQELGLLGAPTPRNRLNIVIHEGHTGGRMALLWALRFGNHGRQNNLRLDQIHDLFIRQTEQLRYSNRVSPCEYPLTARTTTFRFPGLPNRFSGNPNTPPGLLNAQHRLSDVLEGLPGLRGALIGLPGLPSALAGLPGFLQAPPGLPGISNDLVVFLGPGDVLYQSCQGASYHTRTHDWNSWTHISRRDLIDGPFNTAPQRAWVRNTLIPTLAYYHLRLWTETRSIQAHQAKHPTIFPNGPLNLLSTLGDQEGFGSWIGYTVPSLSAGDRLYLLRQERSILRDFLALMIPYGAPVAGPSSRFRLRANGISRV
jgi:hypothetical protein